MPARRKRLRGTRHTPVEGRRASHPAPRATKAEKAEAERQRLHVATMARLRRLRLGILAVGFVPLAGIVGCGTFGIPLFCAVPRDWYFGIWAAVVGSIVGLTIRLVLERRRFEHRTVVGR
ncbi:MAG: hypothetical protein NVSMB8_04760 [Candidatus Limnocylindrales bacterium]